MYTYNLPDPGMGLQAGFFLMAGFIVASLPVLVWRTTKKQGATALTAAASCGWLCFTGLLTFWSGFDSFELPPPVLVLVNIGLIAATAFLFSSLGTNIVKRASLSGLVLFQSFRFPLELLMHRAYVEGLMPKQMSFEGRNLDIFTGITALILGLALRKRNLPEWLVWAWNLLGLGLLFNVVAVAILSTPVSFRMFHNDPPNVWICDAPFVWLPTVMVVAAFFGHLAVARKLSFRTKTSVSKRSSSSV